VVLGQVVAVVVFDAAFADEAQVGAVEAGVFAAAFFGPVIRSANLAFERSEWRV
jgi:hypothetical protein